MSSWKSIDTIPPFEWVEVYSREFEVNAANETSGITLACYRPPQGKLKGSFIEITGLVLHYEFTHWRPIRPNPVQELLNTRMH